MNKTVTKRTSKKEDRKKQMTRIVCWAMVVALILTSGIAMMSWIFQDDSVTLTADDLQAYIDAGILVVDGEGNLIVSDDAGDAHIHEDGTIHTEAH